MDRYPKVCSVHDFQERLLESEVGVRRPGPISVWTIIQHTPLVITVRQGSNGRCDHTGRTAAIGGSIIPPPMHQRPIRLLQLEVIHGCPRYTRPMEGLIPSTGRTGWRDQCSACLPEVGGHVLVRSHGDRDRVGTPAPIPAPVPEHVAGVGYGSDLCDRSNRETIRTIISAGIDRATAGDIDRCPQAVAGCIQFEVGERRPGPITV